jgi:hypothetical protein
VGVVVGVVTVVVGVVLEFAVEELELEELELLLGVLAECDVDVPVRVPVDGEVVRGAECDCVEVDELDPRPLPSANATAAPASSTTTAVASAQTLRFRLGREATGWVGANGSRGTLAAGGADAGAAGGAGATSGAAGGTDATSGAAAAARASVTAAGFPGSVAGRGTVGAVIGADRRSRTSAAVCGRSSGDLASICSTSASSAVGTASLT